MGHFLRPMVFFTLALSVSATAADRECHLSLSPFGLVVSEELAPGQSIKVADGVREAEKLVEIMNILRTVKQCAFSAQTCELDRMLEGIDKKIGLTPGGEHSVEVAARYTISIGTSQTSVQVRSAVEALHYLKTLVDGQICRPLAPQHCQIEAADPVENRAALQVVRGAAQMSVLFTDINEFAKDLTKSGYCTFD